MTVEPDESLRAGLARLAEHGRPARRPDLDELDAMVLATERAAPGAGRGAWWAIAAVIVALGVSVAVVAETRPDPPTTGVVAPAETLEPALDTTTTTRPAEGDADPADDSETATPTTTTEPDREAGLLPLPERASIGEPDHVAQLPDGEHYVRVDWYRDTDTSAELGVLPSEIYFGDEATAEAARDGHPEPGSSVYIRTGTEPSSLAVIDPERTSIRVLDGETLQPRPATWDAFVDIMAADRAEQQSVYWTAGYMYLTVVDGVVTRIEPQYFP